MHLSQRIEQVGSFGILAVSAFLLFLSLQAWRREREPRMLIVTLAYGLFVLFGAVIFLETTLLGHLEFGTAELLEDSSLFLVLGGLLAFFAAVVRK